LIHPREFWIDLAGILLQRLIHALAEDINALQRIRINGVSLVSTAMMKRGCITTGIGIIIRLPGDTSAVIRLDLRVG